MQSARKLNMSTRTQMQVCKAPRIEMQARNYGNKSDRTARQNADNSQSAPAPPKR